MTINFDKNAEVDNNIELVPLDSAVWEACRGAYGNVAEFVKTLMDNVEELASDNLDEDSDEWIAFENLCESLWHQLSFYDATYIALPYLVVLLDEMEAVHSFKRQLQLITLIGMCLMTDIPQNHQSELDDEKILENYQKSVVLAQEKTKVFLESNIEQLKELDYNEKSQFYVGLLAILGDREAAYVLTNLMFNECYVFCEECEFCDEEMEPFSDGEPECIEPAESVIGMWDGKSLDDTYMWYSNVLHMLQDEEAVRALSYYYGVYTCPECGAQGTAIELAKKYFFEMD